MPGKNIDALAGVRLVPNSVTNQFFRRGNVSLVPKHLNSRAHGPLRLCRRSVTGKRCIRVQPSRKVTQIALTTEDQGGLPWSSNFCHYNRTMTAKPPLK